MANEWVSPTGYNDPNGSWSDESNAYDGSTLTVALSVVPARNWSNYIELTINSIFCSKIRFYAKYDGTDGINSIDLDVFKNGSWHDVYQGSFLNRVWVEKTNELDPSYVTKMRIRFYNNRSEGAWAALHEVQFYQVVGVPIVTTNAATAVGGGKATLNGNITDTGGAVCTTRGFKYCEEGEEEEQDISESGSFSTGTYSKTLTGLDPNIKYHFKAYAINSAGQGEGDYLSFGESIVIPTVTTGAATLIDHEKATLNGNITATGGQNPTERGFEWKIGTGGTVSKLKETGSFGIGAYSLILNNLDSNVTYYFRAYAINSAGIGYGDGSWLTNFTTDYTTPTVKTHNATNELTTQVTGNGEIVSTGGKDCNKRGFEYGLSKIATWNKGEIGVFAKGFYELTINGLTANTEYWYRAYARFNLGVDDTQKTTSAFNKDRPQLQVVGNLIYYTWQESDASGIQIWLGTININGTGWVAVKLTSSATNKTLPQFHIVGDKIYYTWQESDGNYQIWTAISDLDGGNFTATKQTTGATNKENPQLQVFGEGEDEKVYYVYQEYVEGYYALMHAVADLDGANWSATQLYWVSLHGIYNPQLEVVGTKIYYVFSYRISSSLPADGLVTAYSNLDGTNFTIAGGDNDSDYDIQPPQLQVVGEKIYYVYATYHTGDPYHQIVVASANLNGTGFSKSKKTTSSVSKITPQLEVFEDKIHYVWHESDGSKTQIWTAIMNIDGSDWVATKKTTSASHKLYPQLQVEEDEMKFYIWQGSDGTYTQIYTSSDIFYIGYGEWVRFITAAPGLPGDKPTGYKNDVCSDNSGFTYILNRSLTDDGEIYESYFVLSTDLSGTKTLHTNKRLEDIFSYFANKGTGTTKVYVKRDSEPAWQYAGEISLAGEKEIIIKHLPSENEDSSGDVDFLAKHFLVKFVFWNDFEFIGMITEAVPIGDR